MAVELANNNIDMMAVFDEEDGYLSDSEAFSSVVEVLEGVSMAPNMVAQGDQDQYDILVSITDPEKRMGPEEEALLVTALKALSGAVSKISSVFHGTLLNNIFSMDIWNYRSDARSALLELIVNLAAVPDKFLDSCLHMLVSNFLPPKWIRVSIYHPRYLAEKRKIHGELYVALRYISELVPLAPMKLKEVIDQRMPKCNSEKEKIVMFVECMLGLESEEIGEFLGSTLLAKVVDLLTDLDTSISWEDILQEENNKGIFDMELEDAEEKADGVAAFGTKALEGAGRICNWKKFEQTLDSLMVIICEHLESCSSNGHLAKVFEMLMESFRKTVMNAYKSKFAQFVVFYACSLDPDICGRKFADMLTNIFDSDSEDPVSRMSAVAYLSSYLSRAKFISSSVVAIILKRLLDWCLKYCQLQNGWEKTMNPKAHRVFYSGCQAVMYILCFRMRSLMDIPNLKSLLFHLPLESVLCHPLDPLKVCLPSIVQEFLRQAKAAHLFKTSKTFLYANLLESEFSKAFGGVERLDTFFPFDPYLLKESDRFMRPNFEFWSMVNTTYSQSNNFDEDEDLDAPELTINEVDFDSDEDDDNLELSMNKMSITPRPAFQYSNNIHSLSQMPARIRPSVSPDEW